MTSISKNLKGNKYNNRYHRTIKIKRFDLKSNTYIDPSKEITKKIS